MVNSLVNILSLIGKGIQMADAVASTSLVALNDKRTKADVFNACAQTIFVGMQAGDLYVGTSASSPQLRQGMAYSVGGLDVVRLGTRTYAESSQDDAELTPRKILIKVTETAATVGLRLADGANVTGLGSHSPAFHNNCQAIYAHGVVVATGMLMGANVYRLNENGPDTFNELTNRFQINPEQVSEDWIDPNLNEEDFFEAYKPFSQANKTADFIKKMKEIPNFLINKYHFPNNRTVSKCSITQKPIRFVVVPIFSQEVLKANQNLCELRYEKESLTRWFESHPHSATPPLGWPAEYWPKKVSSLDKLVQEDVRLQYFIDNDLEIWISDSYKSFQIDKAGKLVAAMDRRDKELQKVEESRQDKEFEILDSSQIKIPPPTSGEQKPKSFGLFNRLIRKKI